MKWSEKSLSYGLTDLSHSNENIFDVQQYTSVIWKKKLLFTCNFILKRTNPVWNAKHRIWLWFKIKINLFFHWIDTICSDTWTRLTNCECSENWVYDQATVRKRIRYWSETLYVFLRRTGIYTYTCILQIVHRACLKMPSMSVLYVIVCFGFLRRIYLFFH